MKRFAAVILSVVLLFSLCVPSTATAESDGIRIPGSWVRDGFRLLKTTNFYSESIRFLNYAFENVDHVTYGETSVLAGKLGESDQLRDILEEALEQGITEGRGSASFYDGSDLEYSIGVAEYTLRLESANGQTVAVFVLKDTYDFTEIRSGGSISNLLNNLGYELQKNGTIKPYTWMVKVVIPVEEEA